MQDRIHQGQEKMQLLKLQSQQEEKKTSRFKAQDILQKMNDIPANLIYSPNEIEKLLDSSPPLSDDEIKSSGEI